ncbi:hypothetical protein COU62_00715 [Candidatus Pacearchaeota archaeon CG10_big_fil_rev_8_21_14_0_10_35_219]|nr:hypothetical protein [Candidatus Pacearchaeota archaeon]OIO42666.1 MAG: hypothetical protein AUJ63_02015 [Candidatus Pacearchaeota archaeon CG1_02_35_32]PIO08311.1 MAG: hypothetical protein COU62_00715 [Candidatus Pacearchaeota archaeon CG10_big_fil_rev_8_21_14_0_10_35_219]PIY81912.1 MAG: hypothetical protein COY79_00455 [Candidatus Pacearchaeota archaeon CG_4_10_14_0_8_um_filter_35_169]PIZ79348.1 MAG: hypothetical protein COY00_04180 [Candidatus Pacearchaeota archaeon CG_4_10_14_0_2_um_filt
MPEEQFKRNIAYKLRIGDILSGKPVLDADKFRLLELGDKHIVRVNIIANVIEKYVQDDEKKFASVTLDDASGQIKLKNFGEEIQKLDKLSQGDTIQVIGVLRSWNNELYILPEIVKPRTPEYLMLRKLETDLEKPKTLNKAQATELRAKILETLKNKESEGGADIEQMITDLKETPQTINQEIKKLLEEGLVYEPRPGKLRYLG